MKRIATGLLSLCLYFSGFAQNVGIGTPAPKQRLHVAGNLHVKDSTALGLVNPQAHLDVLGKTLLRGANTNELLPPVAALELASGRNQFGALGAGVTAADVAFQYGTGGYRHFLATRHFNGGGSSQNAFDFYLNNSNLGEASVGPGAGNRLAASITGRGIGINTASPTVPLHLAVGSGRALLIDDTASTAALSAGVFRDAQPGAAYAYVAAPFAGKFATLTNGQVRMVVDSAGNVGIGTLTPTAPLQVANALRNRTLVLWDGSLNGATVNEHQFHGFGVNQGALRYQVTNPTDAHVFYAGLDAANSRELLRIVGNGNVGIGVDPINSQLQLANVLQNRRLVLWDEDPGNNHRFIGLGVNNGIFRYQIQVPTEAHVFYAGTSATTSQELLRISGNGNVGIGTASPLTALHVRTPTAGRTVAVFESSGGYGQVIASNGTTDADLGAANGVGYTGTNNAGDFYIRTNATTQVVVKDGSGNVGIGTGNPTEKLDVFGNAKIFGTLNVGGVIQEDMKTAVLTNSWVDYGFGFEGARYYRDKQNRVHLQGLIKGGTAAVGALLFTLPAVYRPAGRLMFRTEMNGADARIDITINGEVLLMTAGSNVFLNLSGISFRVD